MYVMNVDKQHVDRHVVIKNGKEEPTTWSSSNSSFFRGRIEKVEEVMRFVETQRYTDTRNGARR